MLLCWKKNTAHTSESQLPLLLIYFSAHSSWLSHFICKTRDETVMTSLSSHSHTVNRIRLCGVAFEYGFVCGFVLLRLCLYCINNLLTGLES